jgi:translation initiation factor 6 (eIF-6)
MNLEELEEALEEVLPAGFQIETDNHGQIVIYTGLRQDDDGELVSTDDTEEDFDPEFDRLDDEGLDEDEDE